jgi:hypothetical protein
MSIYIMTVGELAKRRGEPVGEFVKKLQALGVDAGSHAKKLTQPDLDNIGILLDGTTAVEAPVAVEVKKREVVNPNVLLLKSPQGGSIIAFVDASVNEDGTLSVEVVSQRTETSLGDTLLEFRKQLGIKMGVN